MLAFLRAEEGESKASNQPFSHLLPVSHINDIFHINILSLRINHEFIHFITMINIKVSLHRSSKSIYIANYFCFGQHTEKYQERKTLITINKDTDKYMM